MKDRLKKYRRLLFEIEVEERRREALRERDGFGARRALGIIDARLRRLHLEEAAELRALTAIIEALPAGEQRQVLFARYVDGHAWGDVARLLFGTRSDYWLRAESYERRVYRIHGEALSAANRAACSSIHATGHSLRRGRRIRRPAHNV